MQTTTAEFKIQFHPDYASIQFSAMASPCDLLVDSQDPELIEKLALASVQETKRIENKFSRYLSNNLCHAINQSCGQPVEIDEECFRLLEFANTCFELSDGLFDLTSGVLRKIWRFDGSDNIATQAQVEQMLPFIGWQKIHYTENHICVPEHMELDFGGIGKEYAVSKVAELALKLAPSNSVLVNFGGDIQVSQAKAKGQPWQVGIENPDFDQQTTKLIAIRQGSLATSGDSRRYLLCDGIRYSHILNPKTGWPVQGAPRAVTVAANQCIQAGCLATLALLNGENAEAFLQAQNIQYWCLR